MIRPVDAVALFVQRWSGEVPRWRLRAQRSVTGAQQASLPTRHAHVYRATRDLAQVAIFDIAQALHAGADCSAALVSWARMRLANAAVSVAPPLAVDVVYALGIHELLCDARGIARAVKLAGWAQLHGESMTSESANVLAFAREELSPYPCRATPVPAYASLLDALERRQARALASAVHRAAALYERGGSKEINGLPPIWWTPLPLLLARRRSEALGLPWPAIRSPSWGMWIAFDPTQRQRAPTPVEREARDQVRSLRTFVQKKAEEWKRP